MAKLRRQIKDTVAFAVAANAPIPPEQITDAAIICINRTQAYKPAYLAYTQLAVQSYTILRAHFEQAERDRNKVEDEAAAHGYGMMAATDAADHQMQQRLTDVASALTSLASGESANGSIAGAEQLQAALIRMEANMGQLTQTIANQQVQLAAATQQQQPTMPMMPYCAPAMQRQPFQPMQFNGQQNRAQQQPQQHQSQQQQ